jgi:autotransporter-associated beta strand protein
MATAYAIMEDDETGRNTFRIKEIVVSSPGRYTAADPAQTVTLYGGNPLAPAVVSAVMAATVSGGMTFTGSGTTSLGGTNTYTGETLIQAGTLTLGAGVTLSATREVIVRQALFNSGASFARPILLNGGTLSGSSTLSLAGTGTVFNAAVTGAVAPGMAAGDIGSLLFTGTSALAPGATVYLDVTPTVSDKLELAASVSTTFTGVNFTLNAPELLRRATHYTILSSASGSLSTLPVITNLPEGWLVEEEAGKAVLVFRGNTVLQFM